MRLILKRKVLYVGFMNSTATVCIDVSTLLFQGKLNFLHYLGAVTEASSSKRLHVRDVNFGFNFLIDSSSEVSIVPGNPDNKYLSTKLVLVTANGRPIRTTGETELIIDLCLKSPLKWKFCVPSVPYPRC